MVFVGRTFFTIVPSMAPTTRSAGMSIEAQTKSSSGSITADTSICKSEGCLEEMNLRICNSNANEKPDGALQRKVRSRARGEKRLSEVDPLETMAADMEDLCSPGDFQGEHGFSPSEVVAIRTNLLSWYDKNHRELPWRVNIHSRLKSDDPNERRKEPSIIGAKKEAPHLGVSRDSVRSSTETEGERAYAVWVSEMMLQQTRVATVISYYQRWMITWPTVHALAQASQEDVNSIWAGLGYYRRARFLLEGAKYVVQNLRGVFPGTVEELLKVPGIGSYTAGAIASIAYNQAVPVVDGNVIRVLSRLRAISLNPKASSTVKLFWALASQLVDEARPGDLNQALMELGATICSPNSPSCTSCPVSSQCTAFKLVHGQSKLSSVTCFPTRVPKSAPREEYVAVCIVEREPRPKRTDSSLLLVRRPLKGLLAGLWEFPSAPLDSPDSSEKCRSTAMDKYLHDILGVKLGGGPYSVMKREEVGTYVHVFSHIRLHMFIQWVLLCVEEEEEEEEEEGRSTPKMGSSVVTKWVDIDSMNSLGLTSGVKKVYEMFSSLRKKLLTTCTSPKRKRTKSVQTSVAQFCKNINF